MIDPAASGTAGKSLAQRLLVVEDSDEVVALVTEQLADLAHEVVVLRNGESSPRALRRFPVLLNYRGEHSDSIPDYPDFNRAVADGTPAGIAGHQLGFGLLRAAAHPGWAPSDVTEPRCPQCSCVNFA